MAKIKGELIKYPDLYGDEEATIELSPTESLTLLNCLNYCKHRLSEKHHKDIGLQKTGCTLKMVKELIEKWYGEEKKNIRCYYRVVNLQRL